MVQCLNLSESQNKHMKPECNLIGKIGRGEMAEIIYNTPETAVKRAKTLKQKLKGTMLAAKIEVYGNTLVLTRI